jgi:hypothetical protein
MSNWENTYIGGKRLGTRKIEDGVIYEWRLHSLCDCGLSCTMCGTGEYGDWVRIGKAPEEPEDS